MNNFYYKKCTKGPRKNYPFFYLQSFNHRLLITPESKTQFLLYCSYNQFLESQTKHQAMQSCLQNYRYDVGIKHYLHFSRFCKFFMCHKGNTAFILHKVKLYMSNSVHLFATQDNKGYAWYPNFSWQPLSIKHQRHYFLLLHQLFL